MRTKKSVLVVVCLFLGLSTRLDSQTKEQNKKVSPAKTATQAISRPCAGQKVVATIDLCPKVTVNSTQEEEFKDMQGQSNWVNLHSDIALSFPNYDQVAWTCASHPFRIMSITRIQHTGGGPTAPQPAGFPFCSKERIVQEQPAGAVLYSGAPVDGTQNQCYIYTFEVEGKKVDPHLIVTDDPPPSSDRLDSTTNPARDNRIRCDFSRRNVQTKTNPSNK